MVTKVGRSANLGLKDTQYSINYEFGINRYTVLYIKQINNKDLLYIAQGTIFNVLNNNL